MGKYRVRMRITAAYETEVEADTLEEAKEIAWDSGDFGDAYDIDGEFVACEEIEEEEEGEKV